VRKLEVEAADNGLLAPELASGIARIKGWQVARRPRRQLAVAPPGPSTSERARHAHEEGIARSSNVRDSSRMWIAPVWAGEPHDQARAAARQPWCIVDVVGKHGRVRTIPMPTWTKNAIATWTLVAAVTDGHLFRPVNRGDQVCGDRMSEKVVWQMLKIYVARAGLPDIAPHDLRRTTAKLRRAGNWSRFNCCSGIPRFRPRSGTSGQNRIWRTRRTMQSN